jgi:hypothetical protein
MHTFRCARFCLWRIMCELCSAPGMRISKAAGMTFRGRRRDRAESSGVPPSLWSQLPAETRRQLAQQVSQLVQRLRLEVVRSEEGDRADHDVAAR